MNSPFPGMNPYLENPVFWSEVHHRLIAVIADEIEPNIPSHIRALATGNWAKNYY